jgi:CTP:molybdopterin cytidylyltransferase MocA
VSALRGAGCAQVFVVLGAAADEALALVPDGAVAVVNADWAYGLSTSVKSGLRAAAETNADGILITLVDLPWMKPEHASAALALVGDEDPREALARPTVDGRPGHPVYVGRDHWEALSATLTGDEGASRYFRKS